MASRPTVPRGTARSNAVSVVPNRCGGACTGCCGRGGKVILGRLRFCRILEFFSRGRAAGQSQCTEPCQCVSSQPWACHGALQGQMQSLHSAAGVVGPALGAKAGLSRWFVQVAVLPVCGGIQRRRQHSATAVHRALPVRKWSALAIPWGTARSNAASSVCSRCGGAFNGGCGRAGQVV